MASSLAEINVVPLVDVMLVLLIIFMVAAPMIQRGVDVKLPAARRAAQITGERLFVSVPLAYRQSHIVYLGDEPIRVEILEERVRQKMENRTDKQVPSRRRRRATPGIDGRLRPAQRRGRRSRRNRRQVAGRTMNVHDRRME